MGIAPLDIACKFKANKQETSFQMLNNSYGTVLFQTFNITQDDGFFVTLHPDKRKLMMDSNSLYAVTVGFFDGVHRGHRHLVECLRRAASDRGLKSMIVTFPESPRQILRPECKVSLLNTPEDKMRRLQGCGVDACRSIHFTPELALMDARSFMSQILYGQLGARCIVLGYDHKFGHDRITDLSTYREIGNEIGIEVIPSEPLIWTGAPVSSTRIKKNLECGYVREATEMLGYKYTISGIVVHGLKNGRKMGFPTANLEPHCNILQIPVNGVYAALATVRGKTYKSMLNIGFRPTINGDNTKLTIEAHLLDFDQDIYGEELSLSFVDYIRTERRFDSMEQLSVQLADDRERIDSTLSAAL